MIFKSKSFLLPVFIVMLSFNMVSAQKQNLTDFDELVFFDYRGTNAFDVSGGVTTIVGIEAEERKYGSFYRIGYKRAIIDNLLIGLTFNKYDLPFEEIDHDLVSLDLGLEYLALPYESVSPYLYGGFGYNASDDFSLNAVKIQGGAGVEFIVADGLGIKLFGEYNLSFEDNVNFLILDENNDTSLRIGLGVNVYFGGDKEREKRMEEIDTYIKSNPIESNN